MERAEGVSSIKYHLDTLKARHGCLIGSKGDDLIRISVQHAHGCCHLVKSDRYLSFHGLIQLIGDRTGIEGQTLHNITGMKFIRKADEMNLLLHAFSGELHSEIAQQVNGLQTAVFSIGIGDCDLVFSLFQAGLPGKELREGRIVPEICLFFQQCAVEPDLRMLLRLDSQLQSFRKLLDHKMEDIFHISSLFQFFLIIFLNIPGLHHFAASPWIAQAITDQPVFF